MPPRFGGMSRPNAAFDAGSIARSAAQAAVCLETLVVLLGWRAEPSHSVWRSRSSRLSAARRCPWNISAGSLSYRVPAPPLRVCESSSRTRLALPRTALLGVIESVLCALGLRVPQVCLPGKKGTLVCAFARHSSLSPPARVAGLALMYARCWRTGAGEVNYAVLARPSPHFLKTSFTFSPASLSWISPDRPCPHSWCSCRR